MTIEQWNIVKWKIGSKQHGNGNIRLWLSNNEILSNGRLNCFQIAFMNSTPCLILPRYLSLGNNC